MLNTFGGRCSSRIILKCAIVAAICLTFAIYYIPRPQPQPREPEPEIEDHSEDHSEDEIREQDNQFGITPELQHLTSQHENATAQPAIGLVLAKTRHDDVNWLVELSKDLDFRPYIYTSSPDPEQGFLLPRSLRGRETPTYLSYIVENYQSLPEYSIFIHSSDYHWHNDLFGERTTNVLTALRLQSVDTQGYVNLRCSPFPGCPIDVNPLEPTEEDMLKKDARAYFAEIYMNLFDVGREEVPLHIGGVCCAQFAVSRNRILERPKNDYIRMLEWIEDSRSFLDDYGVGWVFEKVWHIVFGMEAIHCPRYEQCRCDNYGWCGPLISGEILHPSGEQNFTN